jgi:hypothetical protein
VAIPLGPQRRFRFGEIQRVDDVAALPAIVRSILARRQGREAGGDMPEPPAANASAVDPE